MRRRQRVALRLRHRLLRMQERHHHGEAASVPSATHCGLHVQLSSKKRRWWHRALDIPVSLPSATRPRKQKYPGRKRARQRAARQRRREALAPEYQRGLDLLEPNLGAGDQGHSQRNRPPGTPCTPTPNPAFAITDYAWQQAKVVSMVSRMPGPVERRRRKRKRNMKVGETALTEAVLAPRHFALNVSAQ